MKGKFVPVGKMVSYNLDEAVAGLLTDHLVASDADGTSVSAGFTRIAAFRGGVTGNVDACYSRYPG